MIAKKLQGSSVYQFVRTNVVINNFFFHENVVLFFNKKLHVDIRSLNLCAQKLFNKL